MRASSRNARKNSRRSPCRSRRRRRDRGQAARRDTAGIDFAAYDVALIDLLLPRGHDGFAMAQRASAAGIGVILMSGNRSVYDKAEKSPHPFLEKPFRIAQLIETIHQVLERTSSDCERQTAKSA